LEKGDDRNPDVVILNTLPSLYERQGKAKFIGYFMTETSNFKNAGWASKINIMDQCIVPCWFNKESAFNSKVKIPINTVPIPITLNKFDREIPTHNIRNNFPDKFIFYTISEFTRRKNIETIIKAFHLEFGPNEPVELFIKTTPVGLDNPQKRISELIDNVKTGLKLYKNPARYKKENVFCSFASQEEMLSIHKSCDCFISASHGEAWDLPAMDALLAKKIVIASRYGGHLDYLDDKNSYLIDGQEDHCFGCLDTLRDMYVGTEKYFYPSVDSLRECMRKAYSESYRSVNLKKIQKAQTDLKKFSLEEVGGMYRKVLEKLC
jgi:glycosyltransferase involved in cell wall biosynthesis